MERITDGEAFLFYFERWRGSRSVQRLSFAERGMFLELLIEQWLRGDLPDDPAVVADAIALNDTQVAEVHAAWPMLRRLYLPVEGSAGRVFNRTLERVRSERDAYIKWRKKAGKAGGEASAKKRRLKQLDAAPVVDQSLTTGQPEPSERIGLDLDLDRIGSDQKRSGARAPARERRSSVLDGSLPRDHMGHVFCSTDFAICVPSAVHSKFIGPLSRKFGGDREQAHHALLGWYAETAKALPDDCVMSDAFKFWQPRFDAAFASPAPASSNGKKEPASTVPSVERTAAYLRQQQES